MKKIFINLFLIYLRIFAKLQLAKINPIIIGIGGSNGKSSLTEITSTLLSEKYKVKQSAGKNSETGIPLNILNIEMKDFTFRSWLMVALLAPVRLIVDWKKYDVYIVEMGIDSPCPPKNMEYLLKVVKPNMSVLTNIQIEHTLNFDGEVDVEEIDVRKNELLRKISDQEKLLITKMGESGRVILNIDDDLINNLKNVKAKTLTVSKKDKDADFYISKINVEKHSFVVQFQFLKEKYEVRINQPLPFYYAYSLIFGIALAFSNEVSIEDSITILEKNFSLPPGRFSVFEGINGTTLFDSSYNSSLDAAVGAMEVLNRIQVGGRRIGIIGNMNELGSVSKLQHELLGKEIVKNLDYAILIGSEVSKYTSSVLEKNKFKFDAFNNYKKARKEILSKIYKNDYILVKASQNGMFLERVVMDLLQNKDDAKLLCRRGKYWDNIRKMTL